MRLFTDEELAQMGRRTLDVLTEAIDAGDAEKSKKLALRLHREFQAMHDLYCNWISAFISHIARTHGEEAVAAAEREGVGAWLNDTLKLLEEKDFRRKVQLFVAGCRGHLLPMKVVEDDEKVTLILDPCGSGGRLVRGETGYTDFMRLKKPAPVTFGRTDHPAYCTHCPMDDILSIEQYGYPILVCEPAEKIGEGPCKQHIYKDPNKIPESVYKRVGKEKKAIKAKVPLGEVKKRYFTDEELAEMGRRTLDVLNEAIDAGDTEKSKKLAGRMYREYRAMHDLFCNWITALISYVGRTYGEEAVADAEREGVGAWLENITFKPLEGKDFRRQVQMFAAGVRGHLTALKVEEDDEKVTLVLDPCPSGGRIIRGETGYTDFIRLKKPASMTFGRTDFPAYCTECALDVILAIEKYGCPLFACEPAEKLGEGPCKQRMYKDPTKVPESVYKRVGKKKPSS